MQGVAGDAAVDVASDVTTSDAPAHATAGLLGDSRTAQDCVSAAASGSAAALLRDTCITVTGGSHVSSPRSEDATATQHELVTGVTGDYVDRHELAESLDAMRRLEVEPLRERLGQLQETLDDEVSRLEAVVEELGKACMDGLSRLASAGGGIDDSLNIAAILRALHSRGATIHNVELLSTSQ